MALHKITLKHKDGSVTKFFENKNGTWDACMIPKSAEEPPNWVNALSATFMIGTVCAATDMGAKIKIEKGEDR